jgi:hypothetical protein
MSEPFGDDEVDELIHENDGTAVLTVGRDRSTAERARLVRMDLGPGSLLMGPRYALAVSEALARHAMAALEEEGLMQMAAGSTRH